MSPVKEARCPTSSQPVPADGYAVPEPPDPGWIEARLVAARPRAVAALLRHFRDLDLAEEAFQEACLRALRAWPEAGPPRDPEAWLILVGRNATLDHVRRQARLTALPDESAISDREDTGPATAERLDAADYRDDMLRLLFICCHPALPAPQQVALALRIVCGMPTARIARAFLVGERAMEQRITRAKARIAAAEAPFEAPGPAERAKRLAAVATTVYLVFTEGYTDSHPKSERALLCDEAIRLARLTLALFLDEPEMIGLLALMLLQHSRRDARFDATGAAVLLEDQDRTRWNRGLIREAMALLEVATRRGRPGPYHIQAAIAAQHALAARPEDTDWARIDTLYGILEQHAPSPVVTLNRAAAVWKRGGPAAALAMVEPLAEALEGYFYFHALCGVLLDGLGRRDDARAAFVRALALANTPAEAAQIRQYLDRLDEGED